MIGEIGYNVLYENCEHFASFCRYGVAKSVQVHCSFQFSNLSYDKDNVLTKVIYVFIDFIRCFLMVKCSAWLNKYNEIILLRFFSFKARLIFSRSFAAYLSYLEKG